LDLTPFDLKDVGQHVPPQYYCLPTRLHGAPAHQTKLQIPSTLETSNHFTYIWTHWSLLHFQRRSTVLFCGILLSYCI